MSLPDAVSSVWHAMFVARMTNDQLAGRLGISTDRLSYLLSSDHDLTTGEFRDMLAAAGYKPTFGIEKVQEDAS